MKLQDGTAKFRVRDKGTDRVPAGIVEYFAGSKAPKGWLVCDGSAVSRTDYEELFEVIGTMYGAGDGSTTFNLPPLINRFVEGGKNVGAKKEAGLPNIAGRIALTDNIMVNELSVAELDNSDHVPFSKGSGALQGLLLGYKANRARAISDAVLSVNDRRVIALNASLSNPIYGASDTVQPQSLVLLPIIKY